MSSFLKKAGYSLMFTSEHAASLSGDRWESYRRACSENSSNEFLIIPGVEYSDASNVVHLLVWGDIPFLENMDDTERLLKTAYELGGLTVLAHPSRKNAWQKFEISWTPFLIGIEQWNRKVDGVAPSIEAMRLLDHSPTLSPFVGLDFHRINQFLPLAMTFEDRGALSEERVLRVLREKTFSAEAFGISLQHFRSGILGGTIESTERFRRMVKQIMGKRSRH
ncbi:MAG: hypothetical protein ABSB94_14515 [Syntrophorhabdales bacterium]